MEEKHKLQGEVRDIELGNLIKSDWNPNEMSAKEFDRLAQELQESGVVDPIQVFPIEGSSQYQIIGGHHRVDAAKVLGWPTFPCVVLDGAAFKSDDHLKFSNMKLNVIRGKISPDKFIKLYEDLSKRYSDDAMRDAMGMVDQSAFETLLGTLKKEIKESNLPPQIKEKFEETANELKTIDDISNILNYMFSHYGCFHPDTLVSCYDGMKKISDVHVGDMVYTHLGRLKKVLKVWEYDFDGQMVSVRTDKMVEPVLCTDCHEFFTMKGFVFLDSKRVMRSPKLIKQRADQLWYGDFLCVPRTEDCAISSVIIPKISGLVGVGHHPGEVRENPNYYGGSGEYSITLDLCRFLGLYVAEGCLSSDQCHARFNFGYDEDELGQWVMDYAQSTFIGITASSHKNEQKGSLTVCIYGKSLAQWLDTQCGHLAENKKAPSWMIGMSVEFIEAFVCGAVEGDGHVNHQHVEYGTVSSTLAFQMQALAHKIGKHPRIARHRSELINRQDMYIVVWSHTSEKVHSFKVNDYLTLRVKNVDRILYKGKIFDLEVEEDHSYQVMNLAVGNSTLDCGYMILVYGGHEHIYVPLDDKELKKNVKKISEICAEKKLYVEDFFKKLIKKDEIDKISEELIKASDNKVVEQPEVPVSEMVQDSEPAAQV